MELYHDPDWRIIKESVTLPNGVVKNVSRVKRADAAHLLAFIESDKLLVLREYRPYYGEYLWMLPSGRIDKEHDVLVGAQRELQEETGYRALSLTPLFTANFSESIIMTNHFFLATDLVPDPLPQDTDELIEVNILNPQIALQKILGSPKVHMSSAYGLLRYLHERKQQ